MENGHTVPSVNTLEKYARALEIPLYRLFYEPIEQREVQPVHNASAILSRSANRELRLFTDALSKMTERYRNLLFGVAVRLAVRKKQESEHPSDGLDHAPGRSGSCN